MLYSQYLYARLAPPLAGLFAGIALRQFFSIAETPDLAFGFRMAATALVLGVTAFLADRASRGYRFDLRDHV